MNGEKCGNGSLRTLALGMVFMSGALIFYNCVSLIASFRSSVHGMGNSAVDSLMLLALVPVLWHSFVYVFIWRWGRRIPSRRAWLTGEIILWASIALPFGVGIFFGELLAWGVGMTYTPLAALAGLIVVCTGSRNTVSG
ncbi:hypothetical protein [Gordonia sp. i37]|uniref:hypothetical protein n=1 Tax=Gordonia sp. i37 TaxID=1961707 RepID=UPI0009AED0FA|nr:hypothetical protein [Gordonia sp. i37]OPX09977.1 hypothetical protein B1964_24255 [Gordonia sp. i37]